MKILAINGSPRKNGNTSRMLKRFADTIKKDGIETEVLSLSGQTIRGCIACGACMGKKDKKCGIKDDGFINEAIEKLESADAVILGSPVYFGSVTAEMKAFMDRTGMVCRMNDNMLKRKVGAAVVVHRRCGGMHTFDTLNHYFTISEMIVCGSSYWNLGVGREEGAVEQDEEAMETMETLATNMSWLLKKIST